MLFVLILFPVKKQASAKCFPVEITLPLRVLSPSPRRMGRPPNQNGPVSRFERTGPVGAGAARQCRDLITGVLRMQRGIKPTIRLIVSDCRLIGRLRLKGSEGCLPRLLASTEPLETVRWSHSFLLRQFQKPLRQASSLVCGVSQTAHRQRTMSRGHPAS